MPEKTERRSGVDRRSGNDRRKSRQFDLTKTNSNEHREVYSEDRRTRDERRKKYRA